MKKLIAIFVLLSVGYVSAQVNIAVIDMREVLAKSSVAKKLMKEVEKKFKPKQDKLLKMQQEFEKKKGDLERNSSVMTAAQISSLQEETLKLQRDLQRDSEDFRADLARHQEKNLKIFADKASAIVEKVAKAKKLDLILQKATIAYSSERLDITDEIIEKLK